VTTTVRRLSPDEAAAQAKALALEFAESNGMESSLLNVQPDSMQSEREGKIPVHWAAVFTSVHKGVEFDGPTVLLVDLRARKVAFSA
jgi:ribosome biogenesis SPOUT family RNA methylase Rps3